ncbi:lonely Cys domain-containing protein [Streptomyces sp. NPDC057433]|uniref:lonely Cys domain-containing protein n=1 Tax=Streptomyces sp. NPDC057433 TaxID=3346132 RepID=UPI0036B7514B
MAIMFPPGLREFIEVWVGANVATGNEDRGFASRYPYQRLADDVRDLSDAMKGAISTAGNSLPPRIADEFVAAMKLFVDDNGQNHLQKFSDELRDIGSRQVDRSIKLSEAKYQILLEFILMNIELALIAALSVFTGGTSLTEIAIAKARTALTILLLLQRLGRAVPTPLSVLLEAIQEAFVMFAAQLVSMTAPDDPDRRRKEFDWTEIGQSAVAGAFAGFFGGLFSQFSAPIVRNIFKNNHTWKEVFDLPLSFVNEGQAETFAEAFTTLIFLGTFTLNPATFVSAGLSGLLFEAASTGAEYGGKWMYDKFFHKPDFGPDDINHLTNGGGGGGGGDRNGYRDRDRYGNSYGDTYETTYGDSGNNAYGNTYLGTYGNTFRDLYADGIHERTGGPYKPSLSDADPNPVPLPRPGTVSTAGIWDDPSAPPRSVTYDDDTSSRSDVSDISDISTVSSLTDHGSDHGGPFDGAPYGQPVAANGNTGTQPGPGAPGAGKPSSTNTSSDASTNAYDDSAVDDLDTTVPDSVIGRNTLTTPVNLDTDTVFSTLNPPVTTDPGADGTTGTNNGPGNIPSTVGSSAPGLPSTQTGGSTSVPDGTERQRPTADDTTAPLTGDAVTDGIGDPRTTGGTDGTREVSRTSDMPGTPEARPAPERQRPTADDTTAPLTGDADTGGTENPADVSGNPETSRSPDTRVTSDQQDRATPQPDPRTDALAPPVAPVLGGSPAVAPAAAATPTPSTTASPAPASPNATPQQRPQTTPSGEHVTTPTGTDAATTPDDPVAATTPDDPVAAVTPDGTRAPSPEEAGRSAPPSTAPETGATSDVPPPYRTVRTESEELPTAVSPVEPAPAVAREVPPVPPAVADETPLSSRAPAEIPAGPSSPPGSPGSPDSIDMIMDWEDGDASTTGSPEPSPATDDPGHRLLTDVFGPGIETNRIHPALRDALAHLDQLRQADPALRDGPLDLDPLTRRVLLLDSAAPVTDAQRSELFRVAMDPAVESAGSLAALAAFHLQLRGVLSPTRTMTAPGGGVRGRDWTNGAIPDLDLTHVGKVVRQADGSLARGGVETAPWHRPGEPEPYVVMTEGDHRRIVVRGFDGAPRQVPIDVFAELLALDPALSGLPPDVPVVLLVPGAGARGLDLPRRAADRTGREVWSADGAVKVSPQQDPALPHVVSLQFGEGLPRAHWIRSTPGQVLDPAEYGDAPAWEREVRSHSVVTDRGTTIGRGVFEESEAPRRIEALRLATESTELWHYNPVTGESAKDDAPVPFAGKPVYVFGAHARPGATRVPTLTDPRHHTRQRETGGMLKRRPSLARLPKDHAVLMEACSSAKPPGVVRTRRGIDDTFVPDPLAVVSESQHVANETGRTTYGGTHMVSFAVLPDQTFVHRLYTDSRGRRGAWVEHRPEPTGDLLDDRARAAGLHTDPAQPASDATRERTLRLVRALRLTFGAAIEDDSRYGELLAGIGALETMRAADPALRGLGPFSTDLFERAAHAYQRGGAPGPDAYRDLLDRAAHAVRSRPGTVLSDFVALPHVTAAAQRLGGLPDQDLDTEAARILRLDGGPAAVEEPQRARLFWASVKALEWESRTPDPDALTGRLLHLDRPDPARRPELLDLVAQAAAVGVDVDNPTELGAFHLETLGALAPRTQLLDLDGVPTGRRWSPSPPNTTTTTATDRVVVAAPEQGGGYRAVGQERPPWSTPDRAPAYLVWAGGGPDHLTMHLPGGFRGRVPYDEVAELLARDPVLNTRPQDTTDIVLAVPKAAQAVQAGPPTSTGPAGNGTPDTDPRAVVSAGTGRTVWASQGSVSLAPTGPSRPYVPSLLPSAPGRPAAADWAAVRPGDPTAPDTGARTGRTGADDITFAAEDDTKAPDKPPSSPEPDLTVALVPKPTEPDPTPPHAPRLDRAMTPPPRRRAPARFEDGRRMPEYVDDLQALLPSGLTAAELEQLLASPSTFGQSTVALRGFEQAVDAIDAELRRRPGARPGKGGAQLLTDIRRTLRDKPKTLADGDGRPFPYVTADGEVRVLYVRARHYGNWVPFDDGIGDAAKIDSMHRGAATFGLTKNMQANSQYGLGGPIGPAGAAAFGGFGRLALRFGFINKVGYTLADQRMNQMETRTLDASRSFLDDVHYEIRVTDAAGRDVTGTDTDPAAPARFAFGLRNGLRVRLPDSVTKMPKPGRVPRSIDLDRNSPYRFVRIEGFGPVAAIRDWAAGQVGALPGSSAYTELDVFFSSDSFQRHGGTMARGRITTPPLFADDKKKSPLGVFVVEELIPRAAVLVGETDQAEMRDINTSTVRSERSRATGRSLLLQAVAGPAFNFFDPGTAPFDLRLQFGPSAQYAYAKTWSAGLGGAGTLKSAGQVKGPRTALYLVVKSVRVRRAGDSAPPARFLTWSLDRMTSSEARRLAGWDDGTLLALRHGGAPPFVPPYLTVDRPRTLGMHRVKEFTFDDGLRTRVAPDAADGVGRTLLDAFADGVVDSLAQLRQGLVVPLDQLLPPNLPKAWRARLGDLLTRRPDQALDAARRLPVPPRWTDPVTYRIALQNTLQVLGVLSQQNITANLEALTTVGLPVRLTDPDSVGQTYYTLRVHGTLTGRRYEGKDVDEGMRFSAQGVDRLDGQASAKRGVDLGFEGTFSGRDNNADDAGLPRNTLGLTLGARRGWQWEAETAFGSTVTNEPMSVSNQPTHLYRYDLSLTATLGGYWRPRGLIRGLGLGLPGLLVLDEPVNVLFGRTALGHLRGGGPMTGQVLIGVPVQHTPDADPYADGALNPYLSDEPAPAPMTTERALALAKGDLVLPAGTGGGQPAGRLADRGTQPFRDFRQHPFVIVNMVLSPTLTAEVDRVLKEASGSAWHLVKEGAPTREAIVRTFTPQYLAAGFDQSSGPLGLVGSGLLGKGPYGELWGTFRYATTVGDLHALTPPMSMDTEMTLGGTRQAAGKTSNSTSFVFGGQLVYSVAQNPGHGLMGAYGIVANPLSTSRARSLSVVRTVVADMNRKGFTHQVLVAGDVHHWFALVSSRLGTGRIGTTAAASALVPRSLAGAAGTELTSPGGLLGHLPEKSAHRMGLLADGMGDVPRYTRQLWAPQPWLRGAAFGTYAVNALDPTEVLLAFDRRVRELGLDDESRERIRQMVTARATRALKGEMTTTGPSTPVTAGGWGWGSVRLGSRRVRVRVELIPGTPAFDGLDHSAELEENRRAIETAQENSEFSSGADVGLLTSQLAHTGNAQVVAAGPTYTEGGSHRRTVASSHAVTTVTIYRAASTEPHAEIVTPYRMRITLEADDTPHTGAPADGGPPERRATAFDRFRGRLRIIEENDAGELREHVPLSLMEPVPSKTDSSGADGTGADGTGTSTAGRLLPAPDPAADPALAEPPRPVPLPTAGEEVLVRDGEGAVRPFTFPENGMHPRGIVGIENIRVANDLLLTKAYDAGFSLRALEAEDGPDADTLTTLLRRTRETGLTRLGTGSAQALEDGTSTTAVTAFFPRTTEPDGYQVVGLTEKSLVGTDTGRLTLRSTPDFSRALLLTVADGKKLEVLRRYGDNAGTSSSGEHGQAASLGGGFLYDSPDIAGLNQIGLSGPGPNDLDGDGMPVGDDHLTSRNLKPKTGRSFLFAVPATWLSVGDVHRSIVDSKLANRIRGGTFGKARSGPQAMQSEAYVVTWVREDIARDLKLVTDANFPERVAKAWDAVGRASKAWVDADKAYWKKRRASAGLRADLDAAQAALDGAAAIARAAGRPVDLARADVDTADAALRQAGNDARRDHGTADAAVAAAQAEVDALAENEYGAEPEHDGWADLLREEQDAARARLAEETKAAGTLRKAAELRLDTARTEKAAAEERLEAALLSARAPGRSLDDATVRRDTARTAFDARRAELDTLREAAEKAAAEHHRVRAGADQLTRWHRLATTEEGRRQLDGLAEPPAVTYQAPPKAPKASSPAPPRYTRTGTGPDTVLTSPAKETYTLHDVPRDGEAFFRALAHGLERAAPGLLSAQGIDPDGPRAMSELRRRMASWLTDHADGDLLAAVAPDATDAFGADEIAAAGLDLAADTPARREFDGLGGLLPHAVDLTPEVRAELAITQLLRRGDAASEAGWNHSAADLLPLLAARTFGVRVTVVRSDGGFQDFTPGHPTGEENLRGLVETSEHTGAHVVLSLDDRHYRLALPTGQTPPTDTRPPDTQPPAPPVDGVAPPVDPVTPPVPPADPVTAPVGPVDPVVPFVPPADSVVPPVPPADPVTAPVGPVVPLVPAQAPEAESAQAEAGGPKVPPSDVQGQKDGKKGHEPTTTGSPGTRGRRVRVPATGECLLYSFVAGDPVHIRSRLHGLASTDRAAYDWLGQPDAVRGELRHRAALHSTTGMAPTGPSQAVLRAMRSSVEDHVIRSGGRLHPQIVGQFRQTVADTFAARVQGMSRAEMLARLAHHGVRHVPVPEALDPAELLRRYVDARMAARPAGPGTSPQDARAIEEADAGNLGPRQMFGHLEEHGLLPTPGDLDDDALRRLLSTVHTQSAAPLDDQELPALLDAVVNWEQRWGTPEGEVFLPLLAHVFDLRVDVVRSFPSGVRQVSGAGPDNALRQTEVYYNGTDHYEGSDAAPRDRFGAPVLPKRVKDEERDQDGDVRLNPLWVPLDEVDPHLLITGNRDAVWLYTVTDDGRVVLGTESLSGIVTQEQFDALLAGMRERDPELTAQALREALDGLGHTGIAAGFADAGPAADGEKKAGRTLPGRSRVSGEFRWNAKLGSWVVNDKSGRYMSDSVRPGLDAEEAADWLANVAALFSDRLGVVVRTDQVKTAAPAPAPPPQPPPSQRPAPPPPPSAPTATPADRGAPGSPKGAGAYEPGTPSGDGTGELDVARRVGAVLHGLGHPVVLAGAARGRVQFGQPRPLGAVEFQLSAAALPAVAGIRGALEREMPGASVRVWPVTGGGRVLDLSVNGVDITVTAVDRPASGTVTVTVDGFTVPAPADSLADAALALATGTDPELRGRDLLDLLWALHRTPADGPRTVTPVLAREDAYRLARPVGAAPSLAVRLSELLDSAALDPDALARHEQTWRALGVPDADLPALRADLTALADGLRVRPEVTGDPVRVLAARLPGLSTADRDATLASLPPADRERLAGDPVLVDALRAGLAPAEFASVAAHLMTQVPDGVEQPVSAGDRARAQVARLLRDPDVAARLLKGGSRVVVVPRGEAMTSLDAFRFLRGAVTGDGRPWDDVRGAGTRTAAVTEENLLGERTTVSTGMSAYPDGYSTTLHEFAHTLHLHGLDAVDRQRITNTFRTTTRAGEAGNWPDGPLHGYDADGRRSAPNYSSRNELEFFAQLTNVYLMANGGSDPYTGLPRNNAGPEWVRTRQPALYPLLRRLYGEGPRTAPRHPRSVEPARPRGARPADVNPVEATDVENEALARARALWDVAEGDPGDGSDSYVAVRALWDGTTGAHAPQPHTPAPLPLPWPTPLPEARSAAAPPPTDSAVQRRLRELWALVDATFGSQPLPPELRDGLFNSLRVIEAVRAGHPRFGAGLDLDGITRMLLHLAPDEPVDAARHYDALTLVSSAHRRGRSGSLDAVAAYGLTRQGHPEQSVLSGDDGAPHGRNWTGRPGIHLHLDVVADPRGVHPAPWGPAAHAVVAERNAGGAVLADGRPVSDEEFAELVLHDPERQPDVPVVLLTGEEDGRNEALARVIADRTGTRVWFTYGDLRLERAPDGRRVPVLAAPASGSDPAGTWIPADPGLVPDDPAATVRAANGTVFPDADVHSYPLVTVDGQRLTGRVFLNAHDMAMREEALRVVSAIQHYTNAVEGLPGVYAGRQSGALPLPRGLADSYVVVGHGDSGRTTVPRRSTRANQAVHPRQLGRMLARRRSMRELSPETPVWLLICELSMTRADQDLLAHPSSAQYVANETRRTVFTVDRQISPSEAEGSLPPRLIVYDDPDTPVGHIEEFLPEPGTVALDALADLGGLPDRLTGRTDRALHWVRALRRTHGVRIDSDPAREAEFHELIEGFGALERLRFQAAGNADPGLLTWGGLRHIVGQYAARQGWNRSLTAGSLTHLLRAAHAGRLLPSDAAGPTAPAAPPAFPDTPAPTDTVSRPTGRGALWGTDGGGTVSDGAQSDPDDAVGPADAGPAEPAPELPPARSRVAFEHRHRDITDPVQRRQLAELAEEIVVSGLRDLGAGLRIPRTTVTGYSNGPRFALSGGAVEHAETVGRQRADAVRDLLLDEIRRQLERNEQAVRNVLQVRGGTVRAEDFPITTESGGRDIGAVGPIDGVTGRAARRQAVITVDRSPLSAAAARLGELSPEIFDPEDYFADPDRLAGDILHLDDNPGDDPDTDSDSDSSIDPDEAESDDGSADSAAPAAVRFDADDLSNRVRRLYELVDEATAAGRATGRASLTAYHLGKQGMLSDATRLTAPDGAPLGRNWTGRPARDVDVSSYDVVDGGSRDSQPSPWARRPGAPLPYVIGTKDGDHTKVGLSLPDGSKRWKLSSEEFAELLALDEELASREDAAEVVLVSQNAGAMGLDLPRRAAARARRTLWSHSGEVGLKPHPDTGRHRIEVIDDRAFESGPLGEWIGSGPEDLGPDEGRPEPGEGVLHTTGGRTLEDGKVMSFTLTDEGRPVGRAVLNGTDLLQFEPLLQTMIRSTEWSVYDPLTSEPVGDPRPVPWKGRKPYFFLAHGLPGQTLMVNEFQSNVPVRGSETGGFLRRRRSVARLDRNSPIVFLSCWGSGPEGHTAAALKRSRPFVPDPLSVSSAAQGVSNVTRRDVYAPEREHWSRHANGKLHHHGIPTTPANDPVDMVKLRPEPTPDELDALAALAGLAGLGTSPDFTPAVARDTALRLVRALRATFGADVEHDRDDPAGTYRRLLRGVGALEVMRRGDGNLRGHGELTLDLLDRVTRAHHGLTTAPGTRPTPPDPADVRTMLEAASVRLSTDPRSALSDFVSLPSVDRARELIGRHDPDQWARLVLGLHTTAQVTEVHRQNALWATVKAVESVENHPDPDTLTTKVLHLGGTGEDPRDEALRADLLRMAATAAALGRDTYDPTALAAYDLERHGALDDRTLITSVNGTKAGRSWTGKPVPSRLWADRYVISPGGGLGNSQGALAPWHRQGAGKSAHPGGYVLDMSGTTPGQVDMPWPDHSTRSVPHEEIAALLSHDPVLAQLDRDVVIVPVGVGPGAPGLAEAVAARTGAARSVWLPTRPLRLLDRRPAANESLLVMTSPRDDAEHWSQTRPPELPGQSAGSASAAVVPLAGAAPGALTADGDTPPRLDRDGDTKAERAAPPPEEIGPGADAGIGTDPDVGYVPVVPRDTAQRQWVAGQLTAKDLPGDPPRFEGSDTVSPADLRAAGVEMTPGMDVEAQLGGGLRGSGLAPLDQVRLLMLRPGPWPDALDAVAATVSRRIWRSAFTDFATALSAEDPEMSAARAWDTAAGLVLPREAHSVLADSRYAGEKFRDAVRQVADLLAAGRADLRAATHLAARLRHALGLPPLGTGGPSARWAKQADE